MMERVRASVFVADGKGGFVEEVHDAWTTEAPGLVVIRLMVEFADGEREWLVVHQRSGIIITAVANPEEAQWVAAALSGLVDWTMTGTDIISAVGPRGEIVRAAILGVSTTATWGSVPARKMTPDAVQR